jgi:hypothetical protein
MKIIVSARTNGEAARNLAKKNRGVISTGLTPAAQRKTSRRWPWLQ